MKNSATAQNLSDAEADALRRMYEYYVQIPESFYKQTYLELIRWLLDRVEPAHTVGIPVVRTALDTDSSQYGKLDLGPVPVEDVTDFDELASMTERDLVGLPAYPGLTPVGMWMPTNDASLEGRQDPWEAVFKDIPLPSALFPMADQDTGEDLADMAGNVVLHPQATTGSPRWKVHCAGVLVGDKRKDLTASFTQQNIRRGVELTDPTQCFHSTEDRQHNRCFLRNPSPFPSSDPF